MPDASAGEAVLEGHVHTRSYEQALTAAEWIIKTMCARMLLANGLVEVARDLARCDVRTPGGLSAAQRTVAEAQRQVDRSWRTFDTRYDEAVRDGTCAAASAHLNASRARAQCGAALMVLTLVPVTTELESLVDGAITAGWGAALGVVMLIPGRDSRRSAIELAAQAAAPATEPDSRYVIAQRAAREALQLAGTLEAGPIGRLPELAL